MSQPTPGEWAQASGSGAPEGRPAYPPAAPVSGYPTSPAGYPPPGPAYPPPGSGYPAPPGQPQPPGYGYAQPPGYAQQPGYARPSAYPPAPAAAPARHGYPPAPVGYATTGQPAPGGPGPLPGYLPAAPTPPGAAAYPPGTAAAARSGKRGTLLLTLVALAVLALLCGGVAVVLGRPFFEQYPATLSAPDHLAGMTKLTDPQQVKAASDLEAKLKRASGATEAVAAFYQADGAADKKVMIAAVAAWLLDPSGQLKQAFEAMGGNELKVTYRTAYPAGDLGGYVECGNAELAQTPIIVCGWADHGSLGLALFAHMDIDASHDAFARMRSQMLTRR